MPNPPRRLHVVDDVARFAAQRIRRLWKSDGDVVARLRAQLDGVDDEHAGSVLRRVRRARAVAVIGKDDEVQAGACRGRSHVVWRSGSVGAIGVDVKRADARWASATLTAGSAIGARGQRKRRQKKSGGQNGRRHGNAIVDIST